MSPDAHHPPGSDLPGSDLPGSDLPGSDLPGSDLPGSDLSWSDVGVVDLDVATLHDVLALRSAVFVVEQACAYQDVDGLDLAPGTRHLLGRRQQPPGIGAYARLLAPDAERPTPRIGRVIVAVEGRGRRLGRRLMERALESCERHWPGSPVELGAQAHLVGFYRSLGFAAVSEPYDEDGIPHVWMRREP